MQNKYEYVVSQHALSLSNAVLRIEILNLKRSNEVVILFYNEKVTFIDQRVQMTSFIRELHFRK